MQVNITGRHTEITDALRDYAEGKIRKMERYGSKANEANIILSVEKYRHIAEISLNLNGFIITAKEETEEMYSSIDKALDKIERQVRRYKEKLTDHKVSPDTKRRNIQPDSSPIHKDDLPRIIEKRKVVIKPMLPEEAIMQMETQKMNFYLFADPLNEKVKVIYKREDGNVGLIEPVY